jgi:hypothetical protein
MAFKSFDLYQRRWCAAKKPPVGADFSVVETEPLAASTTFGLGYLAYCSALEMRVHLRCRTVPIDGLTTQESWFDPYAVETIVLGVFGILLREF